jgi:hypothetical protein
VAKTAKSFHTVRRLALSIPGAEEGTAWGTPAIKVNGRILACMASHSSAEPNSLVVMLPMDQRDALLDEEPGIYYVKDHYVGHPCVVVRLSRIPEDALRDLLIGSARALAAKPARPASARRTPRRAPRTSRLPHRD